MNKKLLIFTIIFVLVISIIIIGMKLYSLNNQSEEYNNNDNKENKVNNTIVKEENLVESNTSEVEEKEISMDTIKLKVNNNTFNVKLEDNAATKELVERLKEDDVVINANEYGGFEKVGSLGFNLPRSDKNISTSYGDVVLYQGNQISLFYDSNSWSYTKLGKIENVSQKELKDILGNGDVTLVFTIK